MSNLSVQTTYDWAGPQGIPGGIADYSDYVGSTFLNGEETGKMMCGVGVIQGDNPGVDCKLPTGAGDAAKFEGVVINDRHYEMDMEGAAFIAKGRPMAVMRWGRIWVRLADKANVKYGDPLKMKASGKDAGKFHETGEIEVNGRFLSAPDNGVAMAELFNPNFKAGA